MSKFKAGNLIEVAKPLWVIDEDGNILGTLTHPMYVQGSVSLAGERRHPGRGIQSV